MWTSEENRNVDILTRQHTEIRSTADINGNTIIYSQIPNFAISIIALHAYDSTWMHFVYDQNNILFL